jgi:hypothetical protein
MVFLLNMQTLLRAEDGRRNYKLPS